MPGEPRRRRLSEIARNRGPRIAAAAGTDARERKTKRGRATLEDLVPGEETATSRGRHWRHRSPVSDPFDLERLARAVTRLPELEGAGPGRGRLGRMLFLDLETCGFSGNPLFLAGLLRVGGGKIEVTQHFARDYTEESSVVEAALEALEDRPLLVTFNGKSYDLPFLRDRAVRYGLPPVEPAGHLDLLHAARRRWKDILPDCRLQTLEARLTGRRRVADVPGSQVPERYHAFVRGGPAMEMVPVLRHNLLDLVTLVAILGALTDGLPERGQPG